MVTHPETVLSFKEFLKVIIVMVETPDIFRILTTISTSFYSLTSTLKLHLMSLSQSTVLLLFLP